MDPGTAFSLDGRVAFVSGGAGAIGSAIAEDSAPPARGSRSATVRPSPPRRPRTR